MVHKVGVGLSRKGGRMHEGRADARRAGGCTKGGRVHIDGMPASDENIELVKEKGLAALRAMHDLGVIHGDIKFNLISP